MTICINGETVARIAVIDTDQECLALMGEIFAFMGWDLLPCDQPDHAFAVVAQSLPDVIVLDVWLQTPTLGWQVLQQLKSDPLTREIPLIICSGAQDHLRAKEAWLKDRGIAVVLKPFDIDEILFSVESVLQRPSGPGNLFPQAEAAS